MWNAKKYEILVCFSFHWLSICCLLKFSNTYMYYAATDIEFKKLAPQLLRICNQDIFVIPEIAMHHLLDHNNCTHKKWDILCIVSPCLHLALLSVSLCKNPHFSTIHVLMPWLGKHVDLTGLTVLQGYSAKHLGLNIV